jgi:hypothetical protein
MLDGEPRPGGSDADPRPGGDEGDDDGPTR